MRVQRSGAFVAAAWLSLAGCVHAPVKAIDKLAQDLNGRDDGGLWTNGPFPTIDLPPEASPEQVLQAYFKTARSDDPKDDGSFSILGVQTVSINDEKYRAALVQLPFGSRIFLMRPQSAGGWWTKVFDPE